MKTLVLFCNESKHLLAFVLALLVLLITTLAAGTVWPDTPAPSRDPGYGLLSYTPLPEPRFTPIITADTKSPMPATVVPAPADAAPKTPPVLSAPRQAPAATDTAAGSSSPVQYAELSAAPPVPTAAAPLLPPLLIGLGDVGAQAGINLF